MNTKKILKYAALFTSIGIIIFLCVMYLPRTNWYRNLTTPKGAAITATELVKAYQANETKADSLFSGKQIQVSGLVKESKIENGKTTILLQSADSIIGVYFTLKDSIEIPVLGNNITLKGLCTGFLDNVAFNEGEVIKK